MCRVSLAGSQLPPLLARAPCLESLRLTHIASLESKDLAALSGLTALRCLVRVLKMMPNLGPNGVVVHVWKWTHKPSF